MPVRVSMRKIAEVAGVSVATVSHVLNNRSNVCTEATAERIRKVASELGYRVNFGYKLMHSIPTRTVAVLAATEYGSNKEYIRELTLRLLTEFGNNGYAAYFCTLPLSETAGRAKVDEFLARGVENFVFIGMPLGVEQIVKDIEAAGAGMIFNSAFKNHRYIASDSASAVTEQLKYLRQKCGEDFRFFCSQSTISGRDDRAEALRRTFPELEFPEIIRRFTIETPSEGMIDENYFEVIFNQSRTQTRELLCEQPHIRGLAYTNDIAAMGGATAVMALGRTDCIISGFNGDHAAVNFPYPIITARPDIGELVKLLACNAISKDPCQILVMPKLLFP